MSRVLWMFPRKQRGRASLPRLQFAAIAVVPMPRKGSSTAHEHDARQQVDRQTGMLVPLRVQRAGLALACDQQAGRIALCARGGVV